MPTEIQAAIQILPTGPAPMALAIDASKVSKKPPKRLAKGRDAHHMVAAVVLQDLRLASEKLS